MFKSFLKNTYSRHKVSISVLLIIFAGSSIAVFLSFEYTNRLIQSNFARTVEKKSWDQVSSAHEEAFQLYRNFFSRSSDAVSGIAGIPRLQEAVAKGDMALAQSIMAEHWKALSDFSSFSLLDSKGVVRGIASNVDPAPYLGKDLSYRDYFRSVSASKKPYASPAFATVSGSKAIAFSSPILDSNGNLLAVLTGFRTIDKLTGAERSSVSFSTSYSVVCDASGNVLIENGVPARDIVNISANDRVVSKLLSGSSLAQEQEANYRNDNVLSQGSAIVLNDRPAFYVVTYFPQDQFVREIDIVKGEVTELYMGIIFRDLLIMLLAYGSVIWVFRRHVEA